MRYPVILNGDHAEFECEHENTPPKERPDWPLPSFDAKDWAEAFCKIATDLGYKDAEGKPIDEGWMITWFANALMRGWDEHGSRAVAQEALRDHLKRELRISSRHDHRSWADIESALSSLNTTTGK